MQMTLKHDCLFYFCSTCADSISYVAYITCSVVVILTATAYVNGEWQLANFDFLQN